MKTCSLLLLLLSSAAAPALGLFVAPNGSDRADGSATAPLASLEGARDRLRQLRAGTPLSGTNTVTLRSGTYAITEPFVLGPEDSGPEQGAIVYQAAPGEAVTLSGGRRITGWSRHSEFLWKAVIPAVAEGNWLFRELFVNGERRTRARIPNEGFLRVAGCPEGTPKTANYHKDCQSFQFAPGDIKPDWANLADVEVIVYHFWTDSHLPIKSVDSRSNVVTFAHKAGKVFTDDFAEDGARYIVENVFEGLDSPGEWYLNRRTGELFYYPRPGEDMNSVDVVAPFAPALLQLQGDAPEGRVVRNVHFRNLSFEYCNFMLPAGNSNDQQGSASVTAAVRLKGAQGVQFEHCCFARLGNWAIELMAGCAGNAFLANLVTDVGAGAFRLNGGTQASHPLERTHSNRIEDNDVGPYGVVFPSAVGVLLMNTSGNAVRHNLIHNGGYTGISAGWVWGYQRSVSRDNLIEANHIHHIGGILSDMGGIYTLGVSPGTVLRGNLIHHVDANHYGGWGIYHDEGSTGILVENNVVYATKFAGFNIHYAKEISVRNNIFALAKLEQLARGKTEPHKSVFFENNIVYWREGDLFKGDWKDVPYTFHFGPINKGGTRTTTNTFDANWNLYFNPARKLEEVKFAGDSWEAWRKRGKDVNSLYADPLFVDPERGDFSLRAVSPAFKLGFQPVDVSKAGPRVQPGPCPGTVFIRQVGQPVLK
jgi:hypothetical protein